MTKKKLLSHPEKTQQWLNNEIEKDVLNLNNEKNRFIEQIKKIKKEDIVLNQKEIKLTLWEKIKKVLMG
jgi:hypothetical protein